MKGSVRLASTRSTATRLEDSTPTKAGAIETKRVAEMGSRSSAVTVVSLMQLRVATIEEGILGRTILGRRLMGQMLLGRTVLEQMTPGQMIPVRGATQEDSGRWRGLGLA
jgi:hypothetical protein